MANDKNNDSILLSVLLTLLLGGGIVVVLFLTSLHYKYPPEDALLQQLQEPIEFGGEDEGYVQFEEMLAAADQPAEADEQEAGQNDLEDNGVVNEPPQPPLSSNEDSPMKVEQSNPNDTKTQKKTEVKTKDAKSKGENKKESNPNPKTGGNGGGGNQSTSVGRPGVSGLDGYTLENFPTEPCDGPGTVVLQVTVSSTGAVTAAKVTGGSLKNNKKACDKCCSLALRSTFRVPKNTMLERKGTLTYTVK